MYRVRDFLETDGGLIFAVVSNLHPDDGILAYLRFLRTPEGFVKVGSSQDARQLLLRLKPHYLRFVEEFDRELTIVSVEDVRVHYQPNTRLKDILRMQEDVDIVEIVRSISRSSKIRMDEMGITGSHLIGAQSATSDIDLVVYGLDNYHRAIEALRGLADNSVFSLPRDSDWRAIYQKRRINSTDYPLPEFIWHESRKLNRALFRRRRFDILSARTFQEIEGRFGESRYTRLGEVTATGIAVDCRLGCDYPARYGVTECSAGGHEIAEVVSFTHTYIDQLREGEMALFSGVLERVDGRRRYHRILVGSSREAPGEYIRALRR